MGKKFYDILQSEKPVEQTNSGLSELLLEKPQKLSSSASDTFLNCLMECRSHLKDDTAMAAKNSGEGEDNSVSINDLPAVKSILGQLLTIRGEKVVSSAADLLSASIESRNFEVMSECMDFLIKCGGEALAAVMRNYRAYEQDMNQRGVWLEVLAKLGVKDGGIRGILEGHLKLNAYEAVLAIGDYGDSYFIPIVEGIVNKTAASLVARGVNPFQSCARVWDRDADLYIEARTVWIELEYNISAGTSEYEKGVKELDTRLLPHIDIEPLYRKRAALLVKLTNNSDDIVTITPI